MGDLNSRVGSEEGSKIIGKHGEDYKNDNGERLINICDQFELKVNNGFFEHKDIHKYTWVQRTKQLQSIIDYVITKQSSSTETLDVRVHRGAECGSDHHLVKGLIHCPWITGDTHKTNKEDVAPEESKELNDKVKIELLHDESIRWLYRERINKEMNAEFDGNTEEIYDYICKKMKKVSYEVLGKQDERLKLNNWITTDILEKIEEKKKAYQRWLSSNKEEDRKIYNEKKYSVLKDIRHQKNNQWDKVCADINCQLGFKQSTAAWSVLRSLKRNTNHKTQIQMVSLNQWTEYYEQLLNEDREEFTEENDFIHDNLEWEITEAEVGAYILAGKNGKATGPGGIHLEMLKYGGPKVIRLLTRLYRKILTGQKIPDEMKSGYISSIYKKGDRKLCSNYRGICVTNPVMKIFTRIIKTRLEDEYKNLEEQCGFTVGRSCTDHIFTLRHLLEKCQERSKPVGLLFIDLEKAYDSVPRKLVWTALQEAQISTQVIDILKSIYSKNKCQVKVGTHLSREFYTSKGLLQGCCLSPTLFKIYIDVSLRFWSRKCHAMGIQINENYYLHNLLFADDQVIIAQDSDDADYMIRKLIEEYGKWGLKINMNKTQYLTVDLEDLSTETEQIKTVKKFKYLGSILENDGTTKTEIEKRIADGRKVIGMLNSVLWSKNILFRTKKMIYSALVQSIMLYGSETWTINRNLANKLLSTEMDFWRRSVRKSRIDKVHNTTIREIMQVKKNILEVIEERRLRWYGHVRRMSNDRIPKQLLEWKADGTRRRGRPRECWMDGVKRSMNELGLTEDDINDRDYWRQTIS